MKIKSIETLRQDKVKLFFEAHCGGDLMVVSSVTFVLSALPG